MVAAAAGAGLFLSMDGGASWTLDVHGLHARYCSAVALCADDLLVAASSDHFAAQGALYRRRIDQRGTLQPIAGLPRWLEGIVDTGGIASQGACRAVVDGGGNLYRSADDGQTWVRQPGHVPGVSKLLFV